MDTRRTDQAKTRIAVIDDDLVFVDLMEDLLGGGEGYDVVSTPHWLNSFEFLKQVEPDLVILDLMLGGKQTGWSILELLRKDPATALIPVILCSAAEPALRQGTPPGNHYRHIEMVSKPFDVDDLLSTIDRLLHQAGESAA